MSELTEDGLILLYLLKILGPTGRQILKDDMMERCTAGDDPFAHKLLLAINKIERGLAQLAKMTPAEKEALKGG